MQFLLGLVAGLIIGWIVEWIIDWQYWRAEHDDELPDAAEQDKDLRAELDRARLEIVSLRSRLERLDSPAAPERSGDPAGAEHAVQPEPDNLQQIKGIGPVFAQRLNEAGIFTFGQLASASPDAIAQAVQAQEWQAVDPDGWIAAARTLAAETGKGG